MINPTNYGYLHLGQLIYFIGVNDFIPRFLGLFCYTRLWIHFFSWQRLGEGKERLYLRGFRRRGC
jgi:hypothetical protein